MSSLILILIAVSLALLAFLSRQRPAAAVSLLVFLLPSYLLRLHLFGWPTNVFELAVLTVFITTLFPHYRRRWLQLFSSLPFPSLIFLCLWLGAAIVSAVTSPHLITSLGILKGWIIIPLIFGALAALAAAGAGPNHYLRSYLLSALFVSLLSLSLFEVGQRLSGIYDVPNSLALFLVPAAILAWWPRQSAANFIILIVILTALLATQSASAVIALFLTHLAGLVFFRPARYWRQLLALALLLIISVGWFIFSGRLSYLISPWLDSRATNSVSVRLQLWSISLDLIKQHPLLGTGLGTFEPAYQQALHRKFQEFENCKLKIENCFEPLPEFVFRDPHNWPLSFWLNTGLVGLVSFAALNLAALKRGLSASASPPHSAAALALLSLLIFGLVDTIYWKNDLAALHCLLCGILLSNGTRIYQVKDNVRS